MMTAGRVVWKADSFVKGLDTKLARNLDRVGVFLQGEIVKSFGSGGKAGSGGTGGKVHSSPGEPPYVQTGTLRRSITFMREGTKKLLVGSSLQPTSGERSYAWFLEMGTTKMSARPYLRPVLRKNKKTILKMICGK